MFLLLSILVPACLFLFFSPILTRLTGKPAQRNALLVIACFVYFISWYLPSPQIHGENTAFMTHFVGGGVFTGFIWLYVKHQLKWNGSFILELWTLFMFVSALGVANELFELFLVETGTVRLSPADTWWDLLANTLGAIVFWAGYRLQMFMRKTF